MNPTETINSQEYDDIYPYEREYLEWINSMEGYTIPSIRVQLGRDRFLFEQDDARDQFSPYNTINS